MKKIHTQEEAALESEMVNISFALASGNQCGKLYNGIAEKWGEACFLYLHSLQTHPVHRIILGVGVGGEKTSFRGCLWYNCLPTL